MKQGFSFLKLLAGIVLVLGLLTLLAAVVPDEPNEPVRGLEDRVLTMTIGLVFSLSGLAVFAVPMYNRLVGGRNRCHMGMSNVDVLLKRRHDLIDNLVAVTQQYAKHENHVFAEVTAYRAGTVPKTMAEKGTDMQKRFTPSFLAVAEAYPELKANETFKQLFDQLRDTEDKIAAVRIEFNTAVLEQNTRIGSFPDLIVARLFRFREHEFFKIDDSETDAPAIDRA